MVVETAPTVRKFVNEMMKFENFMEFIVYNSVFFLLSVYIGNAIDNIFHNVFSYVESKGWFNKNSNTWLIIQIAIQLIFVSAASYIVRLFIIDSMLVWSSDAHIYDAKATSIIYAFITFFGQDHLKEKLGRLNVILDRK